MPAREVAANSLISDENHVNQDDAPTHRYEAKSQLARKRRDSGKIRDFRESLSSLER
jgi:hypothetical protein